ncbi:Mu transposase C-terminal domain-containing protein [Belnapia rosea]|uniref:Putative transposase n=1 Tax=Belnapia rosea TaxID=938405 RepID=A0A1G7BZS6_9PROT|nr:DDE-type integrase/transposase/recombinase [Belnapia rosea]SDE32571.1 putative transposase [Belnapia rosea]
MPSADDGVPPINIPDRQLALWDGRLMTYRGRTGGRRQFHTFVDEEDVPVTMTDRHFLDEQMAGRIRLVTAEEVERRQKGLGPSGLELASPDDLKEVERRLRYVRAWERAGRPPRTPDGVGGIIADVAATPPVDAEPPSARTLARWVADWLLGGERPEGLLPGVGGYRGDRLCDEARNLLRDTVEKEYLLDTRPTATEVWRKVRQAFEDRNAPLPSQDHLAAPVFGTVLAEIRKVDQFTLDFCREGPRTASHRFRPKTSGPVAERHNDVWEMDHTAVDAVVLDPETRLPIGRATLTSILDRATRAAMGMRMGFEPPSASSALECVEVGVLPKDALLAGIPDLKQPWPCMGLPRVLVTDQGKEFKSKSFLDACLGLGIDVQYTPVLKAWYKGRIERFFRTLTTSVFQRVPGTTFSDFFKLNGEVVPEKVAVTTLTELRAYALHFLVGIYMRRPHRALGGRSPLDLWNESVARHGVRPLPPLEHIRAQTAHVAWRKPQHYGIEYEGLLYNGAEVANYRVRQGRAPSVKIRVDRRDLTRIQFIDPADGEPREVPIVPSMRALVAGVSLQKHKLARALQRNNFNRLAGDEGLKRAYRILDAAMDAKRTGDGLRNRTRAARYWESLTRPPEPEDPPAFDPVRSTRSIIDEVMDGEAPAVADAAHEHGDEEEGETGGEEGGDVTPPTPPGGAAEYARAPEQPRPARKPKGRREGKAPRLTKEDQEDLDELVKGLGLRMSSSKGDE